MSGTLSNSLHDDVDGWQAGTNGDGGAPPFRLLARAQWDGIELLYCREDIRQPVEWSICQPRHTVIVHLGGTMRRLETEIEGAGCLSGPPSPGDIWLVPQGQQYASHACGHIIDYAELRVSPEARVDLPGEKSGPLETLVPHQGHRDEFLYYAIAQLGRWINAEDDMAEMMAERMQLLLRQHLFRDYRHAGAASGRPSRESLPAPVARTLSDYIEASLDQRIRLDDLARLAGLSVHRLLAAFRRSFGTTPAQYVFGRRLRRARWLLLNTGQDIAEIASATGFASHSHFSAAFKRHGGISPRQFRDGLRTRPRL